MKFQIVIASLLFTLVSCSSGLSREDLLPDASGGHGEVLLLMDDGLWNGPLGEKVEEAFNAYAEGVYLRPEPTFDYFRKDPANMNHINKLSRLIVKFMVDTDSVYQETCLLEKPNYFAKNQLFLIIKDSDPNRMYEYVKTDFDKCVDKMNDFELNQLIRQYKAKPSKSIKEKVEKRYDMTIYLPKDAKMKVDKENFSWVKRERSKNLIGNSANNVEGGTYWIQQGIVFWSEEYTNPSQMTVEGALQKRDTVLKYNIPGKVEGSYMATEYAEYYNPEGEIIDYNGVKTVKIQGLWKHAGHPAAFGGGPFLQHSFLHPTNGTIVTVCGYIYAPKFDKREYLRELDAMLRTVEF